jgi:hypothetical protein
MRQTVKASSGLLPLQTGLKVETTKLAAWNGQGRESLFLSIDAALASYSLAAHPSPPERR